MRIGIFGGTFNPPHEGHKKLALEFSGRLSLDLILIVPTLSPPHKTANNLASAFDRLEMCRLCFKGKSTPFIVSDIESDTVEEAYLFIREDAPSPDESTLVKEAGRIIRACGGAGKARSSLPVALLWFLSGMSVAAAFASVIYFFIL